MRGCKREQKILGITRKPRSFKASLADFPLWTVFRTPTKLLTKSPCCGDGSSRPHGRHAHHHHHHQRHRQQLRRTPPEPATHRRSPPRAHIMSRGRPTTDLNHHHDGQHRQRHPDPGFILFRPPDKAGQGKSPPCHHLVVTTFRFSCRRRPTFDDGIDTTPLSSRGCCCPRRDAGPATASPGPTAPRQDGGTVGL